MIRNYCPLTGILLNHDEPNVPIEEKGDNDALLLY